MENYVDSVHGALDHAGPVHRGPVAIASCTSSSKLGLWLLQWSGLPDEGRRRERGARGSWFQAHQAQKAAERWHISGEGGGRESSGVSRSGLKNRARMIRGGAVGVGDAGSPFIGSEGERGDRASEGNGWRQWCGIMVMEAAISGGDQSGWWWGVMKGGCAPAITGAEGVPRGGARAHVRRRRWPSARGGGRLGGARVSARGAAGWLGRPIG
jgi:hypothetical protein